MKFHFHIFGILLGCGIFCVFSSAGAGEVPAGFPVERYSTLWEHSPFTTSSVQQDSAPPGFAQNLALVGIARIGDEDVITLLNRQSLERFIVSSARPNKQGLKVVSVSSDADPLKTSVTLQMGGETGKVGFDKVLLAQTQSAPPPQQPGQVMLNAPQPPNPNAPPVPQTRIRRLPAVPGLSPGPPGSTAPPGPAAPPAPPQ